MNPPRFAHQRLSFDPCKRQTASADLARDGLIGDDAHTQPGRDHRLDDLDVLGLRHDARLDVGADEELVDHASRVGSSLEQDEGLPDECGRRDSPSVGEAIGRWCDEEQLFADHRHRGQRRVVGRQCQQAKIRGPRPQLTHEARRATRNDLDVDVWVAAAELFQKRWEHVETHRHAADQAKRAGECLFGIENAFRRIADIREHSVAQLQQDFTGRRDLDTPAEPDEQRLLEFFFEEEDLTADSGL